MKYRALVSFTGSITMSGGEVREISDPAIAENLLKVGYIEKAEKSLETVEPEKKKSPKRKEKEK